MSTSTEKNSTLSTEAQEFLATVTGLRSAIQRTDLVTVKDNNPESGKAYTSKDKKVLGIPEDNNVIWAWAHFPKETHARVVGMAKAIGKPVAQVCAEVLMDWVDNNYDVIDEISTDHLKSADTDDEIQKKIDAAARQMKKLQDLLNSRK